MTPSSQPVPATSPSSTTTTQLPIRVVCRRTGLKAATIRAWERRYQAVEPKRSDTARRLYTEDDIGRLQLLRQATQAGWRIGQIARLETGELATLVETERRDLGAERAAATNDLPGDLVERSLRAVAALDARGLADLLDEAAIGLSRLHLIQQYASPLLEAIGEAWAEGDLRPAHEHLSSTVLRTYFLGLLSRGRTGETVASIVITTPQGQSHEIGSLLAAVVAQEAGWSVTYLGSDLPAEDIALAARAKAAAAVALGITYNPDGPRLSREIESLRRLIPPSVHLILGGRSGDLPTVPGNGLNIHRAHDLETFRNLLDQIRARPSAHIDR